jgi:hypothetical protein
VIIERQLKTNPYAQRIEQHVLSWFTIFCPNIEIVIYPASNKTKILGAPKSIKGAKKKPLRKKWSIEKASEILTLRCDDDTLKKLLGSKKKDDLADVVCQLASFKLKLFLDGKVC